MPSTEQPAAPEISGPAMVAIGSMCVLGLIGGSLIVAYGGFETSPRRGGTSVFVPAPDAYVIAAIMFSMSCLAMLVLVRKRSQSIAATAAALIAYAAVAVVCTQAMQVILSS